MLEDKPNVKYSKDDFAIKEFNYKASLNDKEREIKILENMQPKKFNKDYVENFVTLLHGSKSLKSNYSIQRKKLRAFNSEKRKKKGIYITSPKLEGNLYQYINSEENNNKDEQTIPFPNYLLEEEQNNSNLNDKNNDDNYDDILTESIRNILYKNKDNEDSDSYKEKEKFLYEQLKTKKIFNKINNNITNLKRSNDSNSFSIRNRSNKRKRNILSPIFIKNFDKNLAKSVERRNLRKLTDNQVKNLYFISQLKVFDNIEEIGRKNKILNELKNYKNKKYLDDFEVFKYNKNKWDKKRKELNKNINVIMFNKFNSDNKKYLKKMNIGVNKIKDNAKKFDKDMEIFFSDLNNFIEKNSEYINENISNKESFLQSKRTSFSRKQDIFSKKDRPILISDNK